MGEKEEGGEKIGRSEERGQYTKQRTRNKLI